MTSRRFLLPALLVCLLTAGLALASSAAAQQKVGEGTSPADMSLAGEIDLLKGTALYDAATGTATFTLTLREAPGTEENPPRVEYAGALLTAKGPCTQAALEAEEKAGGYFPAFEILGFTEPEAGQPEASSLYLAKAPSGPPDPSEMRPATKSVDGTTVTLSGSDSRALNAPFTCVEILTFQQGGPAGHDALLFPLVALPEPPPVVVPAPPAPPAPPVPTPAAAAALSFGKLKPLTLEAEKWAPVRITLTNTGGTATVPGTLKLKLPPGLKVRPVSARQQVPAIGPGGSWTVAFRIKPTEKAKPRSTISFVEQAGSLVAQGSLVAKLAGP